MSWLCLHGILELAQCCRPEEKAIEQLSQKKFTILLGRPNLCDLVKDRGLDCVPKSSPESKSVAVRMFGHQKKFRVSG